LFWVIGSPQQLDFQAHRTGRPVRRYGNTNLTHLFIPQSSFRLVVLLATLRFATFFLFCLDAKKEQKRSRLITCFIRKNDNFRRWLKELAMRVIKIVLRAGSNSF
jgi:hypothetical protein